MHVLFLYKKKGKVEKMDQETIKWIRETVESVRVSIIGRYESGILKPKDQLVINEMLGDIVESLGDSSRTENELVEGLEESLYRLSECLAGKLDGNNIGEVKSAAADVERKLDELDKVNHIANALQLDAQSIIPLLEQLHQKQEEVRQSFQKAVDIDFKIYGQVSDLTKNALEAYHFEIAADKQVIAVAEVDTGKVEKTKPEEKDAVKTETDASKAPVPEERKEYLYIPPMGKEQFTKAIAFLKENGGHFDAQKKAWYIESGSISRKELDAHHLEAAFEDREYLQIPPMGKEQFKKTVEFLKENGARFDQAKKAWYLLPENPGTAIKNYLNQKNSVLSKLKQNETEIDKSRKPAQRQERENGMER